MIRTKLGATAAFGLSLLGVHFVGLGVMFGLGVLVAIGVPVIVVYQTITQTARSAALPQPDALKPEVIEAEKRRRRKQLAEQDSEIAS